MSNASAVRLVNKPIVWLGQSVDTSSLCADYPDLRNSPFLTSLGCAIRKPSLQRTHFNGLLRSRLGITGPLMVDSGGFVLSKNPQSRWSVKNVAGLIAKTDADIFASLDIPPGLGDSAAVRRSKIKSSMRNFKRLTDLFPKKTIMPVVHGRNLSEIALSLNLLDRIRPKLSWIGLGGVVPLLQNRSTRGLVLAPELFIAQALSLVRNAYPDARIHVFGAAGTRTFPAMIALGADSADSIAWRQAAGYGSIFLPLKSQRAVRWNSTKSPPRKVLDGSDLSQLETCRCPVCRDLTIEERVSAFKRNFHDRSIHNAWTIVHQWKFWPRSRRSLRNLVAAGALGSRWARAASS